MCGDGLASLGPGDGGHGFDYEFSEAEKGSSGFVGADKVKELKRTVKEAWEKRGKGHCALTPSFRQSEVVRMFRRAANPTAGEMVLTFCINSTRGGPGLYP